MRVTLERWASAHYSSASVDRWPVGEVREVSAEQGAYLLDTFPEHFTAEPVAEVAPKRKKKAGR